MINVNGVLVKANCYACENLDHVDDQSYECQDGGWCCNGREYKGDKQERNHLSQLSCDKYRSRAKQCCEIKKEWLK